MAKKTKQSKEPQVVETPKLSYQDRLNYEKKLERINGELLKMRYMDLQRACIIRGMDFDLLVSKDIGGLQSWVIKNWDNTIDEDKLFEFDSWREAKLKERGIPDEPFVRLGFIGEENEETGDIDIVKPKKVKKSKDKRERDTDTGIFKGTKKALTFQCFKEGKSIDETILIVQTAFPDAKDKSIKIWIKRAKKKLANV